MSQTTVEEIMTAVLFTEFPVPRNLLGHNGFLDHVAVALRSKYGLIYLQPEI